MRPTGTGATRGRTNGDKVWQPGEQGAAPTSQNGGVGSTLLDPEPARTRGRARSPTFLEHELMPNFGVHVGFVYRRIDQLSQSDNLNRPVSAFNVPIAVPIPNPNGTITATAVRRCRPSI